MLENSSPPRVDEAEMTPASWMLIRKHALEVETVMRMNSRFASKSQGSEHKLLEDFDALRSRGEMPLVKEIPSIVFPFLETISSPETTGPMTRAALEACECFVENRIVSKVKDIQVVIEAALACKFEQSDSVEDEIVISKMFRVLTCAMEMREAVQLKGSLILEITETLLRVTGESRFSEMLRNQAESAFTRIMKVLVLRLPRHLSSSTWRSECRASRTDDISCSGGDEHEAAQRALTSMPSVVTWYGRPSSHTVNLISITTFTHYHVDPVNNEELLCKIFEILAELIDPKSRTDAKLRPAAMCVIHDGLHASGNVLANYDKILAGFSSHLIPSLVHTLLDHSVGSKNFLLALNVVQALFMYLRDGLFYELEIIFCRVHIGLLEEKLLSEQNVVILLEAIADLCLMRNFMSDLYVNYDCSLSSQNLYERLVKLLCKQAFPVSGVLHHSHTIAFRCLVAMLEDMKRRSKQRNRLKFENGVDRSEILGQANKFTKQKLIKRRYSIAAESFNRDCAKGIEVLRSYELLHEETAARDVAQFFKVGQAVGLNKRVIGDFIGERQDFHERVLREYAGLFRFHALPVVDALRLFLETFLLPGESQKIDRITEAFARTYYEQQQEEEQEGSRDRSVFFSWDAVHILTFSIIMLNTDLHSPQVKKRMTLEEFVKNNRGINEDKARGVKEDLPRSMLEQVFHSIATDEIRIELKSHTHTLHNSLLHAVFLSATESSLRRASIRADRMSFSHVGNYGLHDEEMLMSSCGPAVAAVSVVLDASGSVAEVEMALKGTRCCAEMLSSFGMQEGLDNLLVNLSRQTLLTSTSSFSLVSATVQFGRSWKAQKALEHLVGIATACGDQLRRAWHHVLDCIMTLLCTGVLKISFYKPAATSEEEEAAGPARLREGQDDGEGGMANWLPAGWGRISQWLGSEKERTRSMEQEAFRKAREATARCDIQHLVAELRFMSLDALKAVLCALAPIALTRAEITDAEDEKRLNSPANLHAVSTSCAQERQLLSLELALSLALQNRDRIESIWKILFELVCGIVLGERRNGVPDDVYLRAVSGLFQIGSRSMHKGGGLIQDCIYEFIWKLIELDDASFETVALHTNSQFSELIQLNMDLIRWGHLCEAALAYLERMERIEACTDQALELLSFILLDKSTMRRKNFLLCTETAYEFALTGKNERSSRKAIDYLYALHLRLSAWERGKDRNKEEEEGFDLWVHVASVLCDLSLHPKASKDRREYAMLSLERAVMSSFLSSLPEAAWEACFEKVLWRLLRSFFTNAVEANPVQQEKSRLRGWLLLCSVLLQHLRPLTQLGCFDKVWLGFLDVTEEYLVKHPSQLALECVPQHLNAILEVLEADIDFWSGREELWSNTWARLNNFCPQLLHLRTSDKAEQVAHTGGAGTDGEEEGRETGLPVAGAKEQEPRAQEVGEALAG